MDERKKSKEEEEVGVVITLDTPIKCANNNNHCSITVTHKICFSPKNERISSNLAPSLRSYWGT